MRTLVASPLCRIAVCSPRAQISHSVQHLNSLNLCRFKSSEKQILFEQSENGIASMILNRPKANAMGSQILEELSSILDDIEANKPSFRCIIMTSFSDKVFSAGADLKERSQMTIAQAQDFVSSLRLAFDRVARLPVPVIASMEGVAVGGGLELALCADLRVVGENARMGLPETTLAIIPGAGGTQRLPRLIGSAKAKELIFTGRILGARTAMEYGLVNHTVPAGEAFEKATDLALAIVKNGPIAIRAAKAAINEGLEASDMESALKVEKTCYHRVLTTSDRLEGLAAFKEGRDPVYKGE